MPLNDDFLAVFRPFYELRHVLDEFRDAYIHNSNYTKFKL